MIVAFADLDDTLFQTRRKLRGDEGALTPATLDSQGQPHSVQTPAQAALYALLTANATLIPVTGRDQAAMQRVTLPFTSWQILDHGFTMLEPGGMVHQPWATRMVAHLRPLQDALTAAHASALKLAAGLDCHLQLHHVHDAPFMLVAKHAQAEAAALALMQDQWTAEVAGTPLHVIANANNVSVLPLVPGKAGAVKYLLEEVFPDAALTLGLGDSISDLAFMNVCHYALTPSRGQLLRAATACGLPQR